MIALHDLLGDLWDVVEDLVFDEYSECATCQPYDEGDTFWLVPHENLGSVASEIVEAVAAARTHRATIVGRNRSLYSRIHHRFAIHDASGDDAAESSRVGSRSQLLRRASSQPTPWH